MPLDILYPNGQVEAVQVYIWNGSEPELWDGSVTAVVSIGAIAGNKTNNNAAPAADNLGVLGAVATNAAPSYTEGRLVALSTDLTGALRVAVDVGLLATAAKQDTGNASLASIDTKLTSPLTVAATNLDIRDLLFASDKVDVSGSAVTVSGTATISGSVTANAGTNLNTSLLALEAGGNLAAAATSLAILDDWDESDRAKVNLIVGQAGISANAGSVDATTIRTVPSQSSGVNTVQTDLLAIQTVAASSVVISSAFTLSGKQGALIYIRFGREIATASTAGANIRIEVSMATSGNNTWFPLAIFTTAFAACSDEAVSGTVNAGTNVITVASTTGFTAGDIVFIQNGTIANSEWGRVKSIVSNTSITIEDNLVNAQTGSTIYDAAEIYPPVWIPKGILRVRVVDDGSLFTQAHAIQAALTTVDV